MSKHYSFRLPAEMEEKFETVKKHLESVSWGPGAITDTDVILYAISQTSAIINNSKMTGDTV